MQISIKGQITIPQNVIESMGIILVETEIEFLQDERGRWYISKKFPQKSTSQFRATNKSAKLTMSTDEIMALTRY